MSLSAARPTKQWFDLKKEVLFESKDPDSLQKRCTSSSEVEVFGRNEKFLNAEAYISQYVEDSNTDASPEENQENTKFIPFKQLKHFFAEYQFDCNEKNIPKHLRAGETTFRNAFSVVKKRKILSSVLEKVTIIILFIFYNILINSFFK
jgi:hypothetical protein